MARRKKSERTKREQQKLAKRRSRENKTFSQTRNQSVGSQSHGHAVNVSASFLQTCSAAMESEHSANVSAPLVQTFRAPSDQKHSANVSTPFLQTCSATSDNEHSANVSASLLQIISATGYNEQSASISIPNQPITTPSSFVNISQSLDQMTYLQRKAFKDRERYRTDKEFRERKKASARQKCQASKDNDVYKLQKIEAGKRKYADDTEYRNKALKASTTKYATNKDHRDKVMKTSTTKYATNKDHREKVMKASITKYATNKDHRDKVTKAGKRKYANNPQYRQRMQQHSKQNYLQQRLFLTRRERLHYRRFTSKRLKKLILQHRRYVTDLVFRRQHIKHVTTRKLHIKTMENIVSTFRSEISNKPKYVCCVCYKFLWRHQCVVCNSQGYLTKASDSGTMSKQCISSKYLHICDEQCETNCDIASSYRGKLWICHTCHRTLLKGNMPPEAHCNNLELQDIPEELRSLNDVERHLLALRIPFMKMVSLPKGGQKGIIGPCVSVPTDVQKTTNVLPRCDSDAHLIKVKLKRRLPYKGHYKYQFVSTRKLETAFFYLKNKNSWYKDVTLDSSWESPVQESIQLEHSDSDDETECEHNETYDKGKSKHLNKSETEKDFDIMHGAPVDTCLQPDDIGQEILDQYFDDIFCVAPSENSTPVSILKETGNEAMSFPCLFPDGKASFSDDRPVPITPLRYFHNRLLHADSRFAKDSTYIFYAQYVSELQQVISNVSIALRKGTALIHQGQKITSSMITDKTSLKTILSRDQGYKFLKPVRGTPPYWQTTMKDLFSIIRQKGIPTWFCTFSAADMRWCDIIDTILEQQGSTLSANELNWSQKCEILSSNPVMNAVMFNHRFHTLLHSVILSDLHPIGKVNNRFHRIEFQKRGSPHTHCTFWIENSPVIDVDDDATICDFIDKYVTCELPDQAVDKELCEIVSAVQQHSKTHSKSCQKRGTTCRFHFPRPPSSHTFISRPKQVTDPDSEKSPQLELNQAKQILQAIWDIILNTDLEAEEITTENLFLQAGTTQEEYERASDIMTKRISVVLKRSPQDIWINQYNPTLLKCWNANMDMQYILDAYSCVMYIISYISKAERELGIILEETRKEAVEGNCDAEEAMKKVGASYFHQREVCVQEAVYRVCGLHLKECSCKVQFIPVGEDPVRMSIPLKVIQSKSQEPDNEDIWMSSLYDKYKARPFGDQFTSLCYASLCSRFRILSPSQIPKSQKNTVHYLQQNLGCIQERTRSQPAVVRYPRFVKDKNPEQYYQSILQLFLPHRQDQQLKPENFNTYEEFYHSGAVKLLPTSSLENASFIVETNRALFEKNADIIDEAKELMEKAGPLEDAWASLASESEKDRIECEMDMHSTEKTDEEISDESIPDLSTRKNQGNLEIAKTIFTTQQIMPLIRSMNDKQKQIFYYVRQWCIDQVNGRNSDPFHLFITGGAGTGKSHLIKCLFYEVQKLLSPLAPNADDVVALLTAPTGTAAFGIGGTTIHSAFSLSKCLSMPYKALKDDNINSLRAKLQHLQVLFIDEISMVDKKVLIYVSERLRQIKMSRSSQVPFGNVSVIAVGDFYQLPPVKQTFLLNKDPREPVNLFTDYFQMVELIDIMRQKDDVDFANMLNRFRIRKKQDPLNPNDIQQLQQRQLAYHETDALHVFPTNSEVDEHNFHMAQKVCETAMNIIAHDFKKDITTGKTQRINTEYKPPQGSLPTELLIGKGARVMLIRNLNISDGLVNGVFGTVEKIYPPTDETTLQQGILVKFDSERVGVNLRKTYRDSSSCVLIKPVTEDLGKRSCIRQQFPLQPAWACTIHKVQGITTNAITASFEKIFSPGQAYVALSRCTSLSGLMIKDLDVNKIYCDKSIGKALDLMPKFMIPSNKSSGSSSETIHLMLHNIQGLYPHLQDLESNNDVYDCDFLCLTETWLTVADNKPFLSTFQFQHKTRFSSYDSSCDLLSTIKQQLHGGVGVFHKKNARILQLDFGISNIEYLAFNISTLNLTVVIIYRPETYKTTLFIQNLQKFLQKLEQHSTSVMIIGDFNENLLMSNCPINKFMKTSGYKQLVIDATTDRGTIIDHVYTNSEFLISVNIVPTYYSYHNMLSVRIQRDITSTSLD